LAKNFKKYTEEEEQYLEDIARVALDQVLSIGAEKIVSIVDQKVNQKRLEEIVKMVLANKSLLGKILNAVKKVV